MSSDPRVSSELTTGGLHAGRTLTWALLVFGFLAAYHVAWVWQGLDVTDEGFNLTNQWEIVSVPGSYQWDSFNGSVWLSDLLGGLWLKVVGGLGLMGARFGWVLVKALTGVAAFLALQRFFPRPLAAVAVIGTAAAMSFHGTLTIDYNNLPVLLLVGAVAFMLPSQSAAASGRRSRNYALAAGVLLGLSAMARFPLSLSLLLAFVPPIVRTLLRGRDRLAPNWVAALQTLAAGCATVLACLVALAIAGHLRGYVAGITGLFTVPVESSHSVVSLLRTYGATTRASLQTGLAILTGGYGLVALTLVLACICVRGFRAYMTHRQAKESIVLPTACRRRASRARTAWQALPGSSSAEWALVLGWAVALALLMFLALRSTAPDMSHFVYAASGLCLISLTAGILVAVFRGSDPCRAERVTLIAVAAALAVLKMLGSNNGIYSAIDGFWLVMPAALLSLPGPQSARKSARAPRGTGLRRRPGPDIQHVGLAAAVAVLVSVGAAGALIRVSNPYRDLSDRSALGTAVTTPLLRGIHTSPARAESVDDLFTMMARLTRPGDVVLAWDSIPMVHFVTRTLPALGNPWPDLLQEDVLRLRLDEMWRAGGPAAVVIMEVDTRSSTWAVRDTPAPRRRTVDILSECVAHNYTLAWHNAQFAIWVPQRT